MVDTKIVRGQAPSNWRPMCYAESDDGIHWVKPNLNLVNLNGNKNNNICLIEGVPDSLTRVNDFLSVLYEPDDPDPSKRYKAVYIAHVHYDDICGGMSGIGTKERTPCVMICAASADGLRWQVVGGRPANASSLYRFGDFYYSTGQLLSPWTWLPDGREAGRVMMVYRSPDFVNWSKAKAFGFARPGQLTNHAVKGQQTHTGAGIWNRGNALNGHPARHTFWGHMSIWGCWWATTAFTSANLFRTSKLFLAVKRANGTMWRSYKAMLLSTSAMKP